MQDPRALANFNNLRSYRAWEQEGLRRSGFLTIAMSVPAILAPLFIVATSLAPALLRHAAPDARDRAVLALAAFVVFLALAGGLMLFSVIRLNAWKRAHAWAPPTTPGRLVR